ncbi:MAG TPA: LuxR C-terminal-related transcriptional regulator [Streptosporangiaceae bacterium]
MTVTEGRWRRPERPLLDRGAERAAIDELLDAVRGGFSGVLVLRGDTGAGKTTVAGYAIEAASGFQLSAITGVESEINLEYGAVHQLVVPFLPLIGDLPGPQRQAMGVAFGQEAGPSPESFLVGLACLTLLSRAAADQPVLCVVDDAHWIDAESARVLGCVARRLYADRVGVILTVDASAGSPAFEQLPAIEVGGLPVDAAAELLRSVVGAPLDPQAVDRVLADTERIPLALVEVGSDFTAGELAEWAYQLEPIPVGQRLKDRYLRRVRGLPTGAQEFLLLAAADVCGDLGLVRRAAAEAGIDSDAAEKAAESAGLIEVSGGFVRFRHPLMRAAVYHGVTDADRRRAHHWLGQAAGSDDQGRMWHRAAAAARPDESLAADLQAAAERARDRGAYTSAVCLLRRSVALTPDDGRRARREVDLAKAELVIGRPGPAQTVANNALPRLSDGGARGRAKEINGVALFAQGRGAEAADVLVDAAAALAEDPASAAETLLAALRAAAWAGPAAIRKIASTAVPSARPAGSAPSVAELLLAGYQARFTKGYDAAVTPLHAALRALRTDELDATTGLKCFGPGAAAAGSLWDDQALLDITDRWLRFTRRLGALTELLFALDFRGMADSLTGHLDLAADRWTEMRELMAAGQISGTPRLASRFAGLLQALRGKTAQSDAAGQAQIREATARGQEGAANYGRYIAAIADLSAGQFEAAFDAASRVVKDDLPFTAERALPELIEAAVRSGQRDAAASAFAVLADRTSAAGTPWALGLRARCGALLADGNGAEDAYAEAISKLRRSHAALDLARAHLLYGQWLRRAKRRIDARHQLRTAHAMFQNIGADGFAEQAASELRASGERARSRTPETELDLTPQEARAATLAADGATNSEIAAQLFISPGTVEYHLAKVFRKLGITSRTQLPSQLPGRD